jgi:hypothetical protein
MRRQTLWPVVAAAALQAAQVAHAADPSIEELKAQLQQAVKTIDDMQRRVDALERQQQQLQQQQQAAQATPGATATQAATPTFSVVGAPVVATRAMSEEGVPAGDKAHVEFYGQVMLDAIYDFKRMNPEWNATLRPSQIPVACPGDPGCGKDGASIFSVRQSSLGFKSNIPTSIGEIKTDVSFDLFGTDGSTSIHWLNIWAELGKFGVGQYYSNFMDIDVFPNTIDYWGPSGMIFVRNPQLRYTALDQNGMKVALSLEAPNSVLDTGKLSQVDPSFGLGVQPWNQLPDAVGSFRFDQDWGHVRAAAIVRQVGYQFPNTPQGNPSGHQTGWGLNLSGAYKLFGNDSITAQAAYGHAIASYVNDGGVDLAPGGNLRAETVPSTAWLIYYNHAWNDKWTSAVGYSEHRQSNTAGQLGNAFQRGSYASTNLLYTPMKNVLTGLEFIWGQRENKDGSSAPDYRLQYSTKVTF